jgi:pimeloyl-ACP methyl ester carboxylesterase
VLKLKIENIYILCIKILRSNLITKMRAVVDIIISIGLACCVQGAAIKSDAAPVPPNKDPFYKPPRDFALKRNGDILKHRTVPSTLKYLKYKEAHQIMYRSEDSQGEPTYGVTTVIIPENADRSKIVSYQYYEDSAYSACAPSYAFQLPSWDGDISYASILEKGFIVNTPDYEGPNSQYGAAIQEARSTLDSVRAVLASNKFTGIPPHAKVGLWGMSGGSIPTVWASEMQPSYAPDLKGKIMGSAASGVIANLTATMLSINGGLFAGVIVAGIQGVANAYPDIKEAMQRHSLPSSKILDDGLRKCTHDLLGEFAEDDIFNYFKDGEAMLSDPQISNRLNMLAMGKHAPRLPMFIYQGMNDEFTPIHVVDNLVQSYCQKDTPVTYVRSPHADHFLQGSTGLSTALSFLDDCISGHTMPGGCRVSTLDLEKDKVDGFLWRHKD